MDVALPGKPLGVKNPPAFSPGVKLSDQVVSFSSSPSALDVSSCAAVIRRCGNSRDLDASRLIHQHVLTVGHSQNTLVGNLLVQMYGRCGRVELSRDVFQSMTVKNGFSWTMMIMAYTQNGYMREALEFYRKIDVERVKPSPFMFSGILSACLNPADLADGKKIHSHVVTCGCEADMVVSTGLMGMYSRCHSLDLARQVFDRMQHKDTVAWTAMIAAYAQSGHPLQSLDLYKQMNVPPNMYTLSSLLAACSALGDVEQGKSIYERVTSTGMETTLAVQNSLLDMYAKSGSLTEARNVFQSMKLKDDISWSTMLSGYMQHEQPREVLHFYRSMDLEGIRPDLFVFASVLDACSYLGDLPEGKSVHARLESTRGSHLDVVVSSALVNMYAKCSDLRSAKHVFDRIPSKDTVSWTTMIVAYSQDSHCSEALQLYHQMVDGGLKPDAYVYASVLRACASLGAGYLSTGRNVHARVLAERLEQDFVVKNSLLNMYLKCATLEDVREIFDVAIHRDTIVVTMMISAYVQAGFPERALELYREMVQGMRLQPDAFTYASVITACTNSGALAEGKVVHSLLSEDGFDTDPVVQNVLIDMYSKCGSLNEARMVFMEMVNKDVVAWTTLLSGLAKHGYSREALEIFWNMVLESMQLDGITFTTVLQACSHLGLVEQGRDNFVAMSRDFGLEPDVEHYVGMVDVLGRSGRLNDAEELLNSMPYEPTPVAWTTMLGACKLHSDSERAERVRHSGDETACVLMTNIFAASAGCKDST